MTHQATLTHYLARFRHLHRAARPSLGHAPHKPVLLLAILDLIEQDASPHSTH